jgi:hypothetical protein
MHTDATVQKPAATMSRTGEKEPWEDIGLQVEEKQ